MRQALASILFDDHDKESAAAERESVVKKAVRSDAAMVKVATKMTPEMTPEGYTAQSFRSLLSFLGTIVKSWVKPRGTSSLPFTIITTPTEHQRRALDLLGVSINP